MSPKIGFRFSAVKFVALTRSGRVTLRRSQFAPLQMVNSILLIELRDRYFAAIFPVEEFL